MILTIIRYFYYILFFVTPLVMYSKTSELFEFNKMIFIYLITSFVVFLWTLYRVRKGSFEVRLHWLYIPLSVFLLALIGSTIFSIDIHTSIFGYYGRFNGGLLSIVCYMALIFVFIQIADRKFVINALKVIFLSGVSTVLWGLPGRYGYDLSCLIFTGKLTNACWTDQFRPAERMFSTLGQPNWMGAYLDATFFIGMWFLARRDKFFNRSTLFHVGALLLLLMGVLFTRSRSALLGLGAGMALFVPLYLYVTKHTLKTHLRPLLLFVVLLLIPVLVLKTGITAVDKLITLPSGKNVAVTKSAPATTPGAPAIPVDPDNLITTGVTDSFDIRKIVWKGAVDLAARYPVFGTGVETFAYSYYFTRPAEHNRTSEWDFLYNKAHNEFLNYLATTGYVGFIAYLAMIVSVFAVLGLMLTQAKGVHARDERLLAVSLAAAYLTIHVTNFFGFSISVVQIVFYLLPALAISYSRNGEYKTAEAALPKEKLFGSIAQGVCTLGLILSLIYWGRYYIGDMTYASADSYAKAGEYEESFRLYKRALALRYEHVYEDKFSGVLANLAFIASYQSDKDLSKQLIELADSFNAQSIHASPKNALYWKTKAKNNYLHYQTTLDKAYLVKAVDAMGESMRIAPTDAKLPYTAALFYSLLVDEEKNPGKKAEYKAESLQNIETAVTLKQDYREGQILKAQLQKKYGMINEARATLNFILTKIAPADMEAKTELQSLEAN